MGDVFPLQYFITRYKFVRFQLVTKARKLGRKEGLLRYKAYS